MKFLAVKRSVLSLLPFLFLLAPHFLKEVPAAKKQGQSGWLETGVALLVQPDERHTYQNLTTEDEQGRFVELFWQRRDPTPATPRNEFQEEFEKRLAYVNKKFSAGNTPGWKTDRGKIYLRYGPPTSIEYHPSGDVIQKHTRGNASDPGIKQDAMKLNSFSYPFEEWWYNSIPGVGNDIRLEFVDTSLMGDYQLGRDRDIFGFQGGKEFGRPANESGRQSFSGFSDLSYEVLRMYSRLGQTDTGIRFPDLREIVTSEVRYDSLPFEVAFRMEPYTEGTSFVPITVFVPTENLEFRELPVGNRASVNLFIEVSDDQGRIFEVAEDTLEMVEQKDVPPEKRSSCGVYLKGLFLQPGSYRVKVAVQDEFSGRLGTQELAFTLAGPAERPTLSSLIVADYTSSPSRRSATPRTGWASSLRFTAWDSTPGARSLKWSWPSISFRRAMSSSPFATT